MVVEENENSFGVVAIPSTSDNINIIAIANKNIPSVVGRLAYFDSVIQGDTYRAIGTIVNMTTGNAMMSDAGQVIATSRGGTNFNNSGDTRISNLQIQAVFVKDETSWKQYGSSLPNSPATLSPVNLVTEYTLSDMLRNTMYPSVGFFRGMDSPLPLLLPDFTSNTMAVHSGVLGRSGSGKDLSLDTPIPTPNGWTTMGELKDGDLVFDETGKPIRVSKAHEVLNNSICYEVIFSDGSKITAGAGHLWYTETDSSRKSACMDRTVDKRTNATRKTLLTKKQISSLRWLASESDVNETITLPDISKLINYNRAPKWLQNLSANSEVVEYKNKTVFKGYKTAPFSVTRSMEMFNKKQLVEATLNAGNKRIDNSATITNTLVATLNTTDRKDTISFKDFANLVESPVRSDTLRKFVRGLNVASQNTKTTYISAGATYKDYESTFSSPVRMFNKKTLLNKVAEYGSMIINDQRSRRIIGSVKTTQEIKDTLIVQGVRKASNHSIPLANAINYTEKNLPIDPYVFGAWLGDGSSYKGVIYGIDDFIKDEIVSRGYELTHTYQDKRTNSKTPCNSWSFKQLAQELRKNDLLKNKTKIDSKKVLPTIYLQGSIQQRRDLLAGLMDTDGNATKSASVEFTNTNKEIALGVLELANSLGYRATIVEKRATLYGVDKGPKWTIRWSTKDDVFKLPRKIKVHAEYSVNFNEHKNNQRYIVAVNEVATVETRCITVDSPTALYLAGKNFIPTHNTALATFVLAAQMRHESHAILVIDPQGQWSNENGFLFSLQNFAEGLGREVTTLRMSEDIRLPLNGEILGKMIEKIDLWSKFRRMGPDNKEALSQEVAERLVRHGDFSKDPKTVLSEAFESIATSPSTLARIYASIDRRESLRDQLRLLAGLDPLPDEDGVVPIVPQEDYDDADDTWDSILGRFRPIHSLFSPNNLNDGKRRSLGGEKGFLSRVLKVRSLNPSTPAPYVIFDMSPNIALNQKAGLDSGNKEFEMQKLLDNEDIKAIILSELLDEIKRASETAFVQTEGNLNTQIVFDEAWRYAPEHSDSDEISALSKGLGNFARDTRKFGIGWTYILQSPEDLRKDIWKQLTFVYAGYGLVGEDVKKMETLTDDKTQLDFYRKFISPASTGIYPFMITGPASPLIFSNSPSFLNAYSDINEFLENNKRWIREITARRSQKMITSTSLISVKRKKKDIVGENVEEKTYAVGRTVKRPNSQTGDYDKTAEVKATKNNSEAITSDFVEDPPF